MAPARSASGITATYFAAAAGEVLAHAFTTERMALDRSPGSVREDDHLSAASGELLPQLQATDCRALLRSSAVRLESARAAVWGSSPLQVEKTDCMLLERASPAGRLRTQSNTSCLFVVEAIHCEAICLDTLENVCPAGSSMAAAAAAAGFSIAQLEKTPVTAR